MAEEEKWTAEHNEDADHVLESQATLLDTEGKLVSAYDRRKPRPDQYTYDHISDILEQTGPCAGQIVAPSEPPEVDTSAPDMDLELDYVYGYRCFDTRQNVYFNKSTNEIVYCAAALGIVMDTTTNTQRFFGGKEVRSLQGHTDDITALAIHPEGTIIATGEVGKNPAIIVWNSSTCTEISQFRQGEDSRAVTTLSFSGDGSLLASCALDNNHIVRVWDWAQGNLLCEDRGGTDKILDCAWSPSEHIFVTVGIKHIAFWSETESKSYEKKRGIFGKAGKQSDMTCSQYLPSGKALTGGANGFLYMWNGNSCSRSKCPHTEGQGVHTLRVADSCILSGSADKSLVMMNFDLEEMQRFVLDAIPRSCDAVDENIVVGCRNGSIYRIEGENITSVMSSHFDGEVWGLSVSHEEPEIFATVADDNQLKIWNTAERRCIYSMILEENPGKAREAGTGASTMAKTPPNQQARCVAISPSTDHVAIGFNDGKVMVKAGLFDLQNQLAKFKHAKEWIETMRYSPNGKFLAVGSHDNGIYIYDTETYSLKSSNNSMHSSYVVALDWSVDSSSLHSCCGAYELLFWTVSEEGQLEHNPSGANDTRDELWDRFSTHFGWPVQGIFGHLKDYSHVNRVDRSQDGQTFAVGNDWGLVEIFRNPNDMRCYSKGYKAHCEHVTNVKWTYDKQYLLSAGGYDQCIMQWKTGADYEPLPKLSSRISQSINSMAESQKSTEAQNEGDENVAETNRNLQDDEGNQAKSFSRRKTRPEEYTYKVISDLEDQTGPCAGQIVAPSEPPEVDPSAPDMDLELEYVYGYRCFDTRQNVYLNKSTNEIVYCAAALGIVMDTNTNTQRFFGGKEVRSLQGHTDDITALAIHPEGTIIATGEVGKNPAIIVWDSSTCTEIKQFRQGEDSRAVSTLSFSGDGTLLASCALDNNHLVRVWFWSMGILLCEDRGGTDKILDCAWSPSENTFVTAGIKHIAFWSDTESKSYVKKRGIFGKAGKQSDMTCSQYLPNGQAITGGANGFLYLWDGNSCSRSKCPHTEGQGVHTLRVANTCILSGSADKSLVMMSFDLEEMQRFALEAIPRSCDAIDGNIVVGCRNGSIYKIEGEQITSVMSSHFDGEVWGLSVSHEEPEIFATVADDNQLKIWNTAERRCIYSMILEENPGKARAAGTGASTMAKTPPNQQARCVAVSPSTDHVAIGFNNGKVMVKAGLFDLQNQLAKFKHAKEWIETMRYSPDGKFLAVGSHDNGIYIYDTETYSLKSSNNSMHSSYVVALDWSVDSTALHSCCGAYELLFWTVSEEGQLEHNPSGAHDTRDELWDRFSTHFGWPVQGIFGHLKDYSHVNRVDRSQDGQTFAVGNDWGLVEIFRNPNDMRCYSKGYKAHCEHVMNVKWTYDKQYLLSAGGYDQCIMQWKTGADYEPLPKLSSRISQSISLMSESEKSSAAQNAGDENVAEINRNLQDEEGNQAKSFSRRKTRPEQYTYKVISDLEDQTGPCAGQIVAPSDPPEVDISAPDMDLELEYVYGYRCFDTRQNVYLNKSTNEIVYCAAALGIVLDTNTNTQRFFGGKEVRSLQGHTDDITALAIHPEGTLIATGEVGKNPAIIVWDSSTCTEIKQFRQGEDSRAVSTLSFSCDGTLLASCGLDNNHMVRVWDWAKGSLICEDRGGTDKILDCAWSPLEHTFVTTGIKHIAFWSETGSKSYEKKRGIFGKAAKPSDMTCSQYLPSGQAITGGASGFLYIWDGNSCSRCKCPHTEGQGVHTLRVADTCILSGSADKSLVMLNFDLEEIQRYELDAIPRSCDAIDGNIVVGCRNGSIYRIAGKNISTVMSSHFDGEVWGLSVSHEEPDIFATVGDDNQLKVWNTSERRCLYSMILEENPGKIREAGTGASTMAKTPPNQQARCVAISPSTDHVAIGFNNGKVMVKAGLFDLQTQLAKFKHAKEWIETMRYSPNGQFLAVGSHDNGIYIYDTDTYSLKSSNKSMHSSYVVALDWSVDSSSLHSCCGAYELLFWTVSEAGELEHNSSGAHDTRDELWDRFSTHFGWPVQGIFGNLKDYSHVNRVDRSQDRQTFAVGNDWGLVEIFRNPNDMRCYSKGYKAHCEHVTNVKWTYDQQYLLSAGGYDQCIMQWKTGSPYEPVPKLSSRISNHVTLMAEDQNWNESQHNNDEHVAEHSQKLHDEEGNEVDHISRRKPRPAQYSYHVISDLADQWGPCAGQIVAPSEPPEVDTSAPDINLELEYVYGYRCFDTRQNVFFNKNSNEVVYCAAALGIVLDTSTNTQRIFGGKDVSAIQGHTDDITALAVHPEGQIIATGEVGHNPAIIVWDSSNATEISQFKQGDDSRAVTTLAFSSDGSLLATCALDNNHSVRVWDWAKGEQLFENRGGVDKILDCAWSPSEHTFVTAGIKHVAFWSETEENKYSNKRGIFGKAGKQSNMSCAQYLPTGQALTGGSNGDLYVWDGNACSRSTSPHSADAGIHTLRVADSCILSGASDNTLVMLNFELEEVSRFTLDSFPRSCDFFEGKIVAGCRNGSIYIIEGETVTPIMSSHFDGEVWGLAVSSEKAEIFATVGDDNQLKVWNTSEHRCINSIVLEETSGKMNKPGQGASTLAKTPPNQQARCVAISPSNGHVAIGFNNGKVMVKAGIEALDQELAKFKNAKEWIETMRYSPNGKFLAVGSHDNGIYIYSTDDYSLKSSNHMMHSSFIVALDWSVDSSALHSCCGAHELLFWTVSEEGELAHNPNGAEELRDEHWDRFSTHFGWPVQGIFGHLKDYSHVNRVDRSQDGNTFAIGNDWGLVEVIRNPNDMRCYSKGNKAHSSHVTNVKWTYDSAFLLSAGGYDQCIMQWKIA